MRKFSQKEIKYLSFPDYYIEKMEYCAEKKILHVFVEGAWFETEGLEGYRLGKGILFFSEWDSLTVRRYQKEVDRDVEEIPGEPLADLCEVIFSDFNATLRGFSKQVRNWMEWDMINVKMHAEFEDHNEEIYRNL